MITGDHPKTALSIARELKIAQESNQAMTGQELDQLSDAQLAQRLPEIALFARVSAEHKLRIVKGFKDLGSVVAMTGDGVNDAPAIKGASIGIAMGKSGTEVTKEASDMVITDDNFSSIVAAVEEGRGVYENIRKTLQYLLAGNTAELMLITFCVLAGLPMPLLAIHLLWINLVTDGLPALCLATDPIDPDVMNRPPRAMSMDIADFSFIKLMLFTGGVTASVAFVVYILALKYESVEVARTHAFAVLVFAELLRSFGCRSETKTVLQLGLTTNVRLFFVVSISFFLQLASHHIESIGTILKTTSMSLSDCTLLLLAGSIPFVVLEIKKVVFRQTLNPSLRRQ
jgi:Ca2+-transporting ATPase